MEDDMDWRIRKRKIPKRRKSCFAQLVHDSEDDEPITLNKVLDFLNSDEDDDNDLIKCSTPIKGSKPALSKSRDSPSDTINDNALEDKPSKYEVEIFEHTLDTSHENYEINVSVKVESGDDEFDDGSSLESIGIPKVPSSDEDEDLTDVFGENKPIITSVTSLRQNGVNSEAGELNTAIKSNNAENEEHKPKKVIHYKKLYTYDHKVLTDATDADLLKPVRSEPIYEPKKRRILKVKYNADGTPKARARRIRCQHCDEFFYRDALNEHLNNISSTKNKIFDKLVQIPVVKLIDVSNDVNLDPKLKARLRDQKTKLANPHCNYTLRHCVHCDKAFATVKQFRNHIVDVIFGLQNVLEKGKGYKIIVI